MSVNKVVVRIRYGIWMLVVFLVFVDVWDIVVKINVLLINGVMVVFNVLNFCVSVSLVGVVLVVFNVVI